MVDRQGKLDFSPLVEYIQKRDIRNAFALPRSDNFSKMREQSKVFNPDFSGWSLFHSEPMTHQIFTSEDFESDASSFSSEGSRGSRLNCIITREPQIHLIPTLVEGRDDSSGYSSETKSEKRKQPECIREPSLFKPKQNIPILDSPRVSQVKESSIQSKDSLRKYAPEPRVQPKQYVIKSNQTQVSEDEKLEQSKPISRKQNEGTSSEKNKSNETNLDNALKKGTAENEELIKSQAMAEIQRALDELESIQNQVERFTASSESRQYKYLEEKLNCILVRLDDVNADGNEEIRQSRKTTAKKIRACISLLETKRLN